MYLCYVDESGDTGPKGSRHLLLGAAALFEGRWSYIRRDLENILQKYFPTGPRPLEIHCAEVRAGRKLYSKLSRDQRRDLLLEACQAVTSMLDVEVRLFSVVIDKTWWFAQNPGKTGDDLYLDAFEDLVSRFDLFLRRRHAEGRSSKGILIADPHTSDLSHALKGALGRFQMSGTRWANLYNIVETVLFLPSHESPGLQLADLCAYAVWRLVEHGDDSLARAVASAFDREPLSATVNPGKWHGIRYIGSDSTIKTAIRSVWPSIREA